MGSKPLRFLIPLPGSDPQALAERIDWWIAPKERAEMGQRYAESVKKYDAKEAIRRMIEMYKNIIAL